MDNLVEVSRTCHVMWHFANWQLWGNKEDFIAYKGLAGSISELEIQKELTKLIQEKQREEKKAIYGLSPEERKAYGRRGGLKGGKQMKDYIWITDGTKNSRIPKTMEVPKGWELGVTRKKPKKNEAKYGTMEDWNQVQKDMARNLMEQRKKDLEQMDLSKRGSVAALSRLWGVSHAQVRRYLNKIGV